MLNGCTLPVAEAPSIVSAHLARARNRQTLHIICENGCMLPTHGGYLAFFWRDFTLNARPADPRSLADGTS